MSNLAPYDQPNAKQPVWWLHYWRATVVFNTTGMVITSVITPATSEFPDFLIELSVSGETVEEVQHKAMRFVANKLSEWKRQAYEATQRQRAEQDQSRG